MRNIISNNKININALTFGDSIILKYFVIIFSFVFGKIELNNNKIKRRNINKFKGILYRLVYSLYFSSFSFVIEKKITKDIKDTVRHKFSKKYFTESKVQLIF